MRAGQMQSYSRYELFSREVMLLGNNVLLMAAMVVVFLGTMLPLVHKEIGLGSISVGEPFFNSVYSWLVIPFALMVGLGPLLRWRRQAIKPLLKPIALALSLAVVLAYALPKIWADELPAMVVIGLFLAFWVGLATMTEVQQTVKQRKQGWQGITRLSGSHWGMVLGHIGFAVTLIGITLVSHYEQERDIALAPGQSVDIIGYNVSFDSLDHREGPNYDSDAAEFTVTKNGELVTEVASEKRFYRVQRTSMTEVGLDASLLRDIYIAMGEPLEDGAWAIRFYVKPFVRWIWLGAIIMAIGGVFAMADKRYRKRKNGGENE
ncbi:MAG: hypothetical protein MK192_03240 [Idiomarina sp.]|nr:hypothetical protein [Idiomarina sp.]